MKVCLRMRPIRAENCVERAMKSLFATNFQMFRQKKQKLRILEENLLHIWTACYVDYKITQFLPITNHIDGSGSHFWISSRNRHTGSKRTVNTEDNGFSFRGNDSQIKINRCVVTPSFKHIDRYKEYRAHDI